MEGVELVALLARVLCVINEVRGNSAKVEAVVAIGRPASPDMASPAELWPPAVGATKSQDVEL